MKKTIMAGVLATVGAAGTTGVAHADQQASDKQAILALMDDVFKAVASRDKDAWRAFQYADGTTLSVRTGPDGDTRVRMSSNEELVAGMQPTDRVYVERWTEEPTVLIRGPIAVVWGEYDFWIDGTFSHCGVDAIDLLKEKDTWKIVNFNWTVETDGCPTANGPAPE